MPLTSPQARAALASSLVFVGGAAWLALSVFRPTEFTALAQSPSPRALANPFYVFALLLLVAVGLRLGRGAAAAAAEPAEPSSPAKLSTVLLGAGLLLLVLLATYAGAFALSPLSDDFTLLLQASQATPASYAQLFTRAQGGILVRPLGLGVLLGQYHLWGLEPAGYRLVNLLLHFAAAVGLALLAGQLGLRRATAWTAAALFALHPAHPESTVWIASLLSVQSGACVVWSLYFYLRFRERGRTWHLVFSLLLAAAGMLSKETGYVVPVLVAAYDLAAGEPSESWRERLRRWAPFALLLVAGGLYRVALLGGVGGYPNPAGGAAFLDFHPVKTAEALLVRAPALSLLAINWSLPRAVGLQALAALWVVTLAAVFALGHQRALPGRRVWWALGWILLTALPAHYLLLVGADLAGSRHLYLPAAGGALLLAMVVASPGPERRSRWLSAVAVLVLLGLYVAALQHNLRAWSLASEKTRQMLAAVVSTVPDPPPQARFWVVGLPRELNGVHVQTIGLGPALNLRYGRRDLQSETFARKEDLPSPAPGTFAFRWNPAGQQLEPLQPSD